MKITNDKNGNKREKDETIADLMMMMIMMKIQILKLAIFDHGEG